MLKADKGHSPNGDTFPGGFLNSQQTRLMTKTAYFFVRKEFVIFYKSLSINNIRE